MISKNLDLSTAHVTKRDSELLGTADCQPFPLVVYPKAEYGWFISVPSPLEEVESRSEELKQAGMSEDFTNLVRKARLENCDWLILDCDSDVVEDLPTFDW